MARRWYAYNGIGDPLVPINYNPASFPPSCINGSTVCAIYVPGGTSPTNLSTNIRTYIADLQLTLLARPDSNPALKKYVYGKA